jgi:hypothetical protein
MCPEPFRGQTAHPGHVHRVAAAWNHKYLLVKKVCVRNGGYPYGDMIDVCIIELKHAKTQHDSTVFAWYLLHCLRAAMYYGELGFPDF